MRKVISISAIILAALSLAACSNSSNKSAKSSSTSSPETRTISSTNERIAKSLTKEFGADTVDVKVQTDVVDDQSKTDKNGNQVPHQEIRVLVTDKKILDKVKKDKEAIESNKANNNQKLYILGIQETVAKQAKKLSGNDTIFFGYEIDTNQYEGVALANKDKNIIHEVEI